MSVFMEKWELDLEGGEFIQEGPRVVRRYNYQPSPKDVLTFELSAESA
jgi:hypothetical protein